MFVAALALINLMLPYVRVLSALSTDKLISDGFGLTMHLTYPNFGKDLQMQIH